MLCHNNFVSQVQQWSGVRCSCHGGVSGAADKDAAADARSDDHRQPSDGKSAGPAGGGMYTPNWMFMIFNKLNFKYSYI